MSADTSLASKVTSWVGVISVLATLIMTVMNYKVKNQIDEESLELNKRKQDFEEIVRLRTQEIEESRENIARYKFVYDILANVSNKNENNRAVLVNVARLALKPVEEAKLFASLAGSSNAAAAQVGEIGVATITTEKKSLAQARVKEREGFEALIEGNYKKAFKAFEDSEKAYNSYHQVYELGRLVKQRLNDLEHRDRRKEVFKLIVSEYSYGAPKDLLAKLKAMSS